MIAVEICGRRRYARDAACAAASAWAEWQPRDQAAAQAAAAALVATLSQPAPAAAPSPSKPASVATGQAARYPPEVREQVLVDAYKEWMRRKLPSVHVEAVRLTRNALFGGTAGTIEPASLTPAGKHYAYDMFDVLSRYLASLPSLPADIYVTHVSSIMGTLNGSDGRTAALHGPSLAVDLWQLLVYEQNGHKVEGMPFVRRPKGAIPSDADTELRLGVSTLLTKHAREVLRRLATTGNGGEVPGPSSVAHGTFIGGGSALGASEQLDAFYVAGAVSTFAQREVQARVGGGPVSSSAPATSEGGRRQDQPAGGAGAAVAAPDADSVAACEVLASLCEVEIRDE